MENLHFSDIIKDAWQSFDDSKTIISISDESAKVSTNTVFKIVFADRAPVFAKLSYYGKLEHFQEDHIIINNMANNLEQPYENFLARSLTKNNNVFIYKHRDLLFDAWVVFYNPIIIMERLPNRLSEEYITALGREVALFHKASDNIKTSLPISSKTLHTDIEYLLRALNKKSKYELLKYKKQITEHCYRFLENTEKLNYDKLPKIPVFVDWNIGNFSIVGDDKKFFSRWDYDWFRISNRVLDFYFFSRVVSNIGDKTVFSYVPTTLNEDRFILFLTEYHKTYPLSKDEILFITEAYRFFILNYVIKDGTFFFNKYYARKLQKEAYEIYLPQVDTINPELLIDALNL